MFNLILQHRKNTLAKLGRHLVSCSLRIGVKLCVKVDRTSIMKSREYNDTKKRGGLLRKNRSCTYFKATLSKQLRVPLRFRIRDWVWQGKKPVLNTGTEACGTWPPETEWRGWIFFSWLVTKTDTWIRTLGTSREKRYYALLALFSWCFAGTFLHFSLEEMTADWWLVEEMLGNSGCGHRRWISRIESIGQHIDRQKFGLWTPPLIFCQIDSYTVFSI